MSEKLFHLMKFIFFSQSRFKCWNETKIHKYQTKQTRRLIQHAVKHSEFYAEFFRQCDTSNYFALPFMNKKLYMDNFSTLNTKGLTKEECIQHCLNIEQSRDFSQYYKGYLVGMSTGTSGNKGIEFATKFEVFLMQYLIYSRFPFPKARKFHLAFILRVFSPGFSHNGVLFRISYVSPLNPTKIIIDQLNHLNPNLLSGPPSILQMLGKAQNEGRLKLKPLTVISYGEVLLSEVKEKLAYDFQCPIMEVYKSTESLMAISCKYGNLHINEDTTLIEVLDQHLNPVPPGEPGFVVVSDFIKYSTPIIRYQLNDLITIDPKPCPCGSHFRVIKQVHGRADDVILGQAIDSQEYQLILPDFISRSIVRSSNFIEEYNAIQISPTKLIIKLHLKENFIKEQETKDKIENNIILHLENIFSKHGCLTPQIEFQYETLTHDFNNKLRRIRRTFELGYFK